MKKHFEFLFGKNNPKSVNLFLLVFILEGLISFGILASIPSDNEAGFVFGYSINRIILLAGQAIPIFILVLLLFFGPRYLKTLFNSFIALPSFKKAKWVGVTSLFLMAASWLPLQMLYSIFLTTGSYREFAYFERLRPLLGWFFLIGLQLFLWLIYTRRKEILAFIKIGRAALIPTLFAAIIILLVTLFISITGIGIKPDKYGWGAPSVPLMEWQIWLSIIAALLFSRIINLPIKGNKWFTKNDVLICILLWVVTYFIWMSQPVPPGFFATPGRAPNFEIYPFSDGAFYDFYAQNLVIGNGFRVAQIPPRPLYIAFLALIHFLVGQDYNLVVAAQTVLLAFIPVVIFLLGKNLHSTTAGLAAASMAILREFTAIIATPFTDDVSNSKLLFADLPSTLGIALVMLLIIIWLKNPFRRNSKQLAAGFAMGLLLLVRTQSLLLLPLIFIVALFVYRKKLRQFVLDFSLFLLTMALCVSPWLIRNYMIAGQFIFDHPESQSRVMAQRYDYSGDFDSLERQPNENTGDYSNRLSSSIQQTIISHPLYVAEFVTAHFLNNEIGDLLILPVRNGLSEPRELIYPISPFWQEWNGKISVKQGLLLTANLIIIALGIGVSWKRYKLLGLIPLLFNLVYNLSTAIARYSGWRYLLPVDWIGYFYFSVGMIVLFSKLPDLFSRNIELHQSRPLDRIETPKTTALFFPPLRESFAFVLLSVIIGMSLIAVERIVPPRYSLAENKLVLSQMSSNPTVQSSEIDKKALSLFDKQPDTFIVKGRALYPRYYGTGEGELKTAKTGYAPSPDARLVFMVASQPDGLVIFKTDTPPSYFPNGADVSIIGCQTDLYAQALIITVHGQNETTYISPDAKSLDCQKK